MAKKKIGVILSGCGVMDGAEIHESVIALLALDRAGAEAVCMAPNIEQTRVWNHLKDQEAKGETRNVLVESARIARGNIKDLATVHAKDVDAVILPGGFGAALNLCTFGMKGPDCEVNPEVARLLEEMRKAAKPIGAICIAPAAVARALGAEGPELTIGTDQGTAAGLEKMGAKHIACSVSEFHVDRKRKIVTTPAYMLGKSIKDVAEGIEKLVREVLALAA